MSNTTDNCIIWWPRVCGNNSLDDAFWATRVSVNTDSPDLTSCFQQTAMTWVTCGATWLVLPAFAVFLSRTPTPRPTWGRISRLNLAKLVVCGLLVVTSLLVLLYNVVTPLNEPSLQGPSIAALTQPAITTATYAALGVLSHWVWRAGLHTSGVLSVLWLLQAAAAVIGLQSGVRAAVRMGGVGDVMFLTCTCVTCVLTLVQLGLSVPVDPTALNAGRAGFGSVGDGKSNGEKTTSPMGERTPLLQHQDMPDQKSGQAENAVCATTNNPSPVLTCSFLSDITFWWFGKYQTATSADVTKNSCHISVSKGDGTGSEEYGNSPPLLSTLWRMYGGHYPRPVFLRLINTAILIANPFIMRALLDFVQVGSAYSWRGYGLAALMFVCAIMQVLTIGYYVIELFIIGIKVKTLITGMIYRKALRLSSRATKAYTTGEIVNMMSVDAQKLHDAAVYMCELAGHASVVLIGQLCLWQLLGPACMAGLVLVLVVMPALSTLMGNSLRKLQMVQMKHKDERIKLTTQVMNGIKVLKLYAWEPHFKQRVSEIRDLELRAAWWTALINAGMFLLWFVAPVLVALLDFGVYTGQGHMLDAQTAFTSLAIIQMMSMVLTSLPQAINNTVQGYVSLRRLDKFLASEERDPDTDRHISLTDAALEIAGGSFTWADVDRPVLTDVTVRVPRGALVAVVGVVGSGKSSLISALLGDMHRLAGTARVNGSVAYVPQQAWIQNLSLRDNILFGRPHKAKHYNAVIDGCALCPDLDILAGGDSIEIGERGINLSGGQKARVSLARAVYQDRDVYLLDDPLSAVDAHVGKHIFEKVIGPDGILKDKTRLLVTHSLTYLAAADAVVVMCDGQVTESGPYSTLLAAGGTLSQLVNTFLCEVVDDELEENKDALAAMARQVSVFSQGSVLSEDKPESLLGSTVSGERAEGVRRRRARPEGKPPTLTTQERTIQGVEEKAGSRLTQEEGTELGTISWSVVKAYALSATPLYFMMALCSLAAYTACLVCSNIWLSEWTQDAQLNVSDQTALVSLRLGVYGGLGGGQALAVLGLAVGVAFGGLAASRSLHAGLLTNILRCPMAFFDTTPVGRVINRFSRDIDQLDVNVPQLLVGFLSMAGAITASVIVVLYSLPIMAAVIFPLACVYILIQRFYMYTARQLKRIDSVCRSPIFSFFNESLSGASVIRAFNQTEVFTRNSDRLVDISQAVWLEVLTCARWVSLYTDILGDIAIITTAIFSVLLRDSLNPGIIGLALSSMITLGPYMVWGLRTATDLESYIVAVERIKEYSEIEKEAPWSIPGVTPVAEWPEKGSVTFTGYSTRYRPGLDLVLKDLNVHISAGEKVGVVGRTGAGKSSMTLALFRIIESVSGNIHIDGVDVSQIGLHDLRSNITIIPQDPVLFSGSLRFNIDPASSCSDAAVWRALQQAHLQPFVERLPNTLQYECGEEGNNLSVGQRQLVCLARALLRKTKLLVLDEATAAVDLETDELIQATIRAEFKDCTVITIAHRINTILDYDRVIVMDAGVAKEFDKPTTLLDDPGSAFHAMAKDAALL